MAVIPSGRKTKTGEIIWKAAPAVSTIRSTSSVPAYVKEAYSQAGLVEVAPEQYQSSQGNAETARQIEKARQQAAYVKEAYSQAGLIEVAPGQYQSLQGIGETVSPQQAETARQIEKARQLAAVIPVLKAQQEKREIEFRQQVAAQVRREQMAAVFGGEKTTVPISGGGTISVWESGLVVRREPNKPETRGFIDTPQARKFISGIEEGREEAITDIKKQAEQHKTLLGRADIGMYKGIKWISEKMSDVEMAIFKSESPEQQYKELKALEKLYKKMNAIDPELDKFFKPFEKLPAWVPLARSRKEAEVWGSYIERHPFTTVVLPTIGAVTAGYVLGFAAAPVMGAITKVGGSLAAAQLKIIMGGAGVKYVYKTKKGLQEAETYSERAKIFTSRVLPIPFYIAGGIAGAKGYAAARSKFIQFKQEAIGRTPIKLSRARTRVLGMKIKQVGKGYEIEWKRGLVGKEYGTKAPTVSRGKITGKAIKGKFLTVDKTTTGILRTRRYDIIFKRTPKGIEVRYFKKGTFKLLKKDFLPPKPSPKMPKLYKKISVEKWYQPSMKYRKDFLLKTGYAKIITKPSRFRKIIENIDIRLGSKTQQYDYASNYIKYTQLSTGEKIYVVKTPKIIYSKLPTYLSHKLTVEPIKASIALQPELFRFTKAGGQSIIKYNYKSKLDWDILNLGKKGTLLGGYKQQIYAPMPTLFDVKVPTTFDILSGAEITAIMGQQPSQTFIPLVFFGETAKTKLIPLSITAPKFKTIPTTKQISILETVPITKTIPTVKTMPRLKTATLTETVTITTLLTPPVFIPSPPLPPIIPPIPPIPPPMPSIFSFSLVPKRIMRRKEPKPIKLFKGVYKPSLLGIHLYKEKGLTIGKAPKLTTGIGIRLPVKGTKKKKKSLWEVGYSTYKSKKKR